MLPPRGFCVGVVDTDVRDQSPLVIGHRIHGLPTTHVLEAMVVDGAVHQPFGRCDLIDLPTIRRSASGEGGGGGGGSRSDSGLCRGLKPRGIQARRNQGRPLALVGGLFGGI